MPTSWLEELKDLICKIYREWGGDCANLPFAVGDQITALEASYAQLGVPTFPSAAARDSYIALLASAEAHLDSGSNSLSTDEDTRFRQLIDSLQADLAGGDT